MTCWYTARSKALKHHLFQNIGIIYDVIVEPPSIGSTTDERGHSRPVSFPMIHLSNNKNLLFSVYR